MVSTLTEKQILEKVITSKGNCSKANLKTEVECPRCLLNAFCSKDMTLNFHTVKTWGEIFDKVYMKAVETYIEKYKLESIIDILM